MKKIITILIFSFISLSYAQNIPDVFTTYTKTGNDTFHKEKFQFKLNGNYIEITDLDFNKKERYGPLRIIKKEYKNNGTYIIQYYSDVTKNNGTDVNMENVRYFNAKGIRVYEFNFDRKGGDVLVVGELMSKGNTKKRKSYFTDKGYNYYK